MPDSRVKGWVEVAVAAALGAVLSLIKVYTLPQGGSVTVTTLPVLFLALWRGPKAGATAGLVLGLLKLALGPIIVHPVQVLLDYPVPYALLCVAGLFPRYPAMGVLVGSLCRGASHALSGVIFFASYAPPGVSVWKYSVVYNASHVLPEALICIVLIPILLRRVAGAGAGDRESYEEGYREKVEDDREETYEEKKYKHEEKHEKGRESHEENYREGREDYTKETDEEKAYRILGVPPTATNDQIKRTYRTLASVWHPDVKTVEDDSRMKEINWAYEFLKDKRQFQ